MALNRGGKAAEQEATQRRTFDRAEYFRLEKSGDSTVIRFIDDSDKWIYVGQHSFVKTKDRPADMKADEKWPDAMSAVCRADKAFQDPDSKPYYPDGCYICDHIVKPDGKKHWPQVRLWARAVLREAVLATAEDVASGKYGDVVEGQRLGYRDAEREIKDEKTNEVKRVKKIVVVNMGVKNFFGAMQGYYDVYGTVLDRDYHVTRSGSGTDTDYKIVPLDPIAGHNLRTPELQARYAKHAADASISEDDLEKMIIDLSSDDYFARFFDPTKQAPKRATKKDSDSAEGSRGASAAEQEKPAEAPIDQSRLAAMKSRVMGGNHPTAAAGAPQHFN